MGNVMSKLKVVALACVLGHRRTYKELEASLGRCSCRGDRFNVTLERTSFILETDSDSTPDGLMTLAAEVLLTGRPSAGPEVSASIQTTQYELFDVEGPELLRQMKRPVEETSVWIHETRLAHARANLKPGQRICATCGAIFTPPRVARLQDEFCSPTCRKAASAVPSVQAPAPSRRVDVACPHCGRILQLRGDVLGKTVGCPACSKKFSAQPISP